MLKISYAGCLGLFPATLVQFTLEVHVQPEIAKNSLKPPILGFKVIQGHRCWHFWEARCQCLLRQAAC